MSAAGGRDSSSRRWLERLAADPDCRPGSHHGYHPLSGSWSVARPRGLAEHLVYLVVAGSCGGYLAGVPVTLSPGRLMWLPPRTSLALHASGTASMTLYRFRFTGPDPPPEVTPFLLLPDAWEVRPLVDALVLDLDGTPAFGDLRSRALLVAVLATVLRLAGPAARTPSRPTALLPAQRVAIEELLDTHPDQRPTVGELADAVHLSEEVFRRRFRATFGLPPRGWLVRRRIHAAARWLDDTAEQVRVVADRFGYTDVFLFSRQFKAIMGVSPRTWRDRRQAHSDA